MERTFQSRNLELPEDFEVEIKTISDLKNYPNIQFTFDSRNFMEFRTHDRYPDLEEGYYLCLYDDGDCVFDRQPAMTDPADSQYEGMRDKMTDPEIADSMDFRVSTMADMYAAPDRKDKVLTVQQFKESGKIAIGTKGDKYRFINGEIQSLEDNDFRDAWTTPSEQPDGDLLQRVFYRKGVVTFIEEDSPEMSKHPERPQGEEGSFTSLEELKKNPKKIARDAHGDLVTYHEGAFYWLPVGSVRDLELALKILAVADGYEPGDFSQVRRDMWVVTRDSENLHLENTSIKRYPFTWIGQTAGELPAE